MPVSTYSHSHVPLHGQPVHPMSSSENLILFKCLFFANTFLFKCHLIFVCKCLSLFYSNVVTFLLQMSCTFLFQMSSTFPFKCHLLFIFNRLPLSFSNVIYFSFTNVFHFSFKCQLLFVFNRKHGNIRKPLYGINNNSHILFPCVCIFVQYFS